MSLTKLKDAITALEGGLALPTGSVGSPNSMGTFVTDSWKARRLGPAFTEAEIEVRASVEKSLLACFGIPSSMTDPSAASGAREGYRQFTHLTLRPIAEIVAEELGAKLDEPDLQFHFEDLSLGGCHGTGESLCDFERSGRGRKRSETVIGFGVVA